MKKIKIATISSLVLLQIIIMFEDVLSSVVILVILPVLLGMLVLLNVEAFKIKNKIKELVIWADIFLGVLVLYYVLSDYYLLPKFMISGYSGFYISGTFLLLLEASILVVLVRAYKEE